MRIQLAACVGLGWWFMAACGGSVRSEGGGQSGNPSDHPSGGRASGGAGSTSAGSIGASGATATPILDGGASSAAGSASSAAGSASSANCIDLPYPTSPPGCVRGCNVDAEQLVSYVCEAGAYRCPAGFIPIASCATNSCVRRYEEKCCNEVNGHAIAPECGPDGLIYCGGSLRLMDFGSMCKPTAVTTDHCFSLSQQSCPNLDYQCSEGRGCASTNCTCDALDGATPIWTCPVLLC